MRIEITDAPSDAGKAGILDGLRAYNLAIAGVTMRPIAVFVHDDDGQVIGGLTGRTGGGWMFVEYLWLPPRLRGSGMGAEIIGRAEQEAVARGCTGVWLDTFSFQAPGFYESQGYETFGMLDDFAGGAKRHFMSKRLNQTVR